MRTFLLAALTTAGLTTAGLTTAGLTLPALAEDADVQPFLFSGHEVDTSFEASRARLEAQDYREIEMIDGSPYHLAALDQGGAEVLLTISPQDGEILSKDERLEVATSPSD